MKDDLADNVQSNEVRELSAHDLEQITGGTRCPTCIWEGSTPHPTPHFSTKPCTRINNGPRSPALHDRHLARDPLDRARGNVEMAGNLAHAQVSPLKSRADLGLGGLVDPRASNQTFGGGSIFCSAAAVQAVSNRNCAMRTRLYRACGSFSSRAIGPQWCLLG